MLYGSTILMADDDPATCEQFRHLLEPHGVQMHVVHTGDEALDWLRSEAETLDLVILDVQFPLSRLKRYWCICVS